MSFDLLVKIILEREKKSARGDGQNDLEKNRMKENESGLIEVPVEESLSPRISI
jgi:hypothetical protein